jgi:hypothetical protein
MIVLEEIMTTILQPTRSLPRLLLHLEGAVAFASAIVAFAHMGGSVLLFVALLLLPDLAILGYRVNVRVGAGLYNLVHTYALPLLLLALSLAIESPSLTQWALIWLAHIGMDRMLGYGLKYPTTFKDTHLQRV